jgi:DNA-binding transcriptional regulator YiaG
MITMKKEKIDIKALRLRLGLTQEDVARRLGLALSTVCKWEQGVTSPSRLAYEKIEMVFGKGGKKKK